MSQALAELRAATRPLHDRLEATLAIAREDAGIAQYRDYLEDMWGWLAPFEPALRDADWPGSIAGRMQTSKLAWIEADLQVLTGSTTPTRPLPRCAFVPDLTSEPARYGVAYVIEGAQLGTRVLRRRLAGMLGDWSPRWLEGYGDDGPQHWRMFLAELESSLPNARARMAATEAAAEAFGSLDAWNARCEARRAGAMDAGAAAPFLPSEAKTDVQPGKA